MDPDGFSYGCGFECSTCNRKGVDDEDSKFYLCDGCAKSDRVKESTNVICSTCMAVDHMCKKEVPFSVENLYYIPVEVSNVDTMAVVDQLSDIDGKFELLSSTIKSSWCSYRVIDYSGITVFGDLLAPYVECMKVYNSTAVEGEPSLVITTQDNDNTFRFMTKTWNGSERYNPSWDEAIELPCSNSTLCIEYGTKVDDRYRVMGQGTISITKLVGNGNFEEVVDIVNECNHIVGELCLSGKRGGSFKVDFDTYIFLDKSTIKEHGGVVRARVRTQSGHLGTTSVMVDGQPMLMEQRYFNEDGVPAFAVFVASSSCVPHNSFYFYCGRQVSQVNYIFVL